MLAAQGPTHPSDGGQRASMLANLSKHNRGASVTPNIPNLVTDLGSYAGRGEGLVGGQAGTTTPGEYTGQSQPPSYLDSLAAASSAGPKEVLVVVLEGGLLDSSLNNSGVALRNGPMPTRPRQGERSGREAMGMIT